MTYPSVFKMKYVGWEPLHRLFKLLCILTTIGLIIWCCYEYNKDEDVCEVLFKRFHKDHDSVYPELTFGLSNRFNETALKAYDTSFNQQNYQYFLSGGRYWDEKMLDIDFNKVSMHIDDFVIKTCLYESLVDNFLENCKYHPTIKRVDLFEKALFTLQFPSNRPMHSAKIQLKNSIFPGGLRPSDMTFFVAFAYPNQIYRSISSCFYTWPLRTNASTKNYLMRFTLKSMEVLRKRKKKGEDCYDKEDYDSKIMDTIIETSGCRPNMWSTNRTEPLCRTRKSFQEIYAEHGDQAYRTVMDKEYIDPCLNIEKLQIDYIEEDIPSVDANTDDDEEGSFTLEYHVMAEKFKEIKQVRKYSVQGLVGNLGGYIGLCLGYAIMNLPTIILDIWKNIKKLCSM